jgi:hypothetical protein
VIKPASPAVAGTAAGILRIHTGTRATTASIAIRRQIDARAATHREVARDGNAQSIPCLVDAAVGAMVRSSYHADKQAEAAHAKASA